VQENLENQALFERFSAAIADIVGLLRPRQPLAGRQVLRGGGRYAR
jgi:hypothetical protein